MLLPNVVEVSVANTFQMGACSQASICLEWWGKAVGSLWNIR